MFGLDADQMLTGSISILTAPKNIFPLGAFSTTLAEEGPAFERRRVESGRSGAKPRR
jgi:hypothetical protein